MGGGSFPDRWRDEETGSYYPGVGLFAVRLPPGHAVFAAVPDSDRDGRADE
jgi:hypothetical protein